MKFPKAIHCVFLINLILASSCSPIHAPTSRTMHDAGRVVNETQKWNWVEMDLEEFRRIDTHFTYEGSLVTYNENSPLMHRIQQWIDRIDTAVRAHDPEGTRFIPRPKANLRDMPMANAYVSALPICTDLTVHYQKDQDPLPETSATAYLRYHRNTWTLDQPDETCIKRSTAPEDRLNLAQYLWRYYPNCQLSEQDDHIVATGDCGFNRSIRLHSVAYYSTTNIISVFNGLVSQLNLEAWPELSFHSLREEEFVSILLHEMGHYYLSHSTAPASIYDFNFFSRSQNPDHKPQSDLSAEILNSKLQLAFNRANEWIHPTLETAWEPSTLSLLADSNVADFCGDDTCAEACPEIIVDVPACMQHIPREKIPNLVDRLSSHYSNGHQVSLGLTRTQEWKKLPNSLAVLEALNQHVTNARTIDELAFNQVQQEAIDKGLSTYTQEYEADQFATEWMSRLGIDPHFLGSALFAIFSANKNGLSPITSGLGYDACKALSDRGWKNEAGQDQFVPFALEGKHASFCYRIFDIHREMEAHHLTVIPPPAGPMLTPDWSTITAINESDVGKSGQLKPEE